MKKDLVKKLIPLLTLLMAFSVITSGCGSPAEEVSIEVVSEPAIVSEPVIEPWQEAYADFLRKLDRPVIDLDESSMSYSFFTNDMDDNGIPELVIVGDPLHSSVASKIEICTYMDGATLISELINTGHVMYIPLNKSLPGFFTEYSRMGMSIIAYHTLGIGGVKETLIYEIDENVSATGTIHDQELYDEYKNSTAVTYYAINGANIQKYIYGGVMQSNPHPFTIALQGFFEDATGSLMDDGVWYADKKTAAILADLDSDGVDEMIAVKVFRTLSYEYGESVYEDIIKMGIFNANGSISPFYDEYGATLFYSEDGGYPDYKASIYTDTGLSSLCLTEANYIIPWYAGSDVTSIGIYNSGNLKYNELYFDGDNPYFNGTLITLAEAENYTDGGHAKKTLYSDNVQAVTDESAKIFRMTASN